MYYGFVKDYILLRKLFFTISVVTRAHTGAGSIIGRHLVILLLARFIILIVFQHIWPNVDGRWLNISLAWWSHHNLWWYYIRQLWLGDGYRWWLNWLGTGWSDYNWRWCYWGERSWPNTNWGHVYRTHLRGSDVQRRRCDWRYLGWLDLDCGRLDRLGLWWSDHDWRWLDDDIRVGANKETSSWNWIRLESL